MKLDGLVCDDKYKNFIFFCNLFIKLKFELYIYLLNQYLLYVIIKIKIIRDNHNNAKFTTNALQVWKAFDFQGLNWWECL